ncbi:tRNA pseudouridine synthase [Elysia marginata]|uniref:tRNA pseudouridine synthase n=1 Tax=Elysia marginata TaxID=1093978 RepID=A0AAV4HLP5_9GAST|nr:tRNA pseudouridine synthase [Elysia marginata]
MGRFLIFFSYVGKRYSGVQQQLGALRHGRPVKTAGGVLEEALGALSPVSSPRIQVSSRTDRGVHALRNSCHVDLQHPESGKEYDPAIITNVTNYNLLKMGEDVRVVETRRVADDFHSRANAIGRKYVYRLAHSLSPGLSRRLAGQHRDEEDLYKELKKFTQRSKHPKLPLGSLTPILDQDKIFISRSKLDISKLLQAAALLSGIHDFTSFSNKPRTKEEVRPPPHPVKLLTIGVKRGRPLGHKLLSCGPDVAQAENLEFWDIHVQAKSFLYKMVRRCVGGMILVATDVISLADLQDVLENPRRDFPFTSRLSLSEAGLFLVDVEYQQKDLMFNVDNGKIVNCDQVSRENQKSCSELNKTASIVASSSSNPTDVALSSSDPTDVALSSSDPTDVVLSRTDPADVALSRRDQLDVALSRSDPISQLKTL